MKDTIILWIIIGIAAFFGTSVILSPAPLWLKIGSGLAFGFVILGCLDAILAIRYNDRRGGQV